MDGQERFDRMLSDFNIRLLTSRLMRAGAKWNGVSIRSGFWRLYVNNRSGGGVRVGARAYPLAPGRVHLVPAWCGFKTWLNREVNHFYMHFDLVGLPAPVVTELFTEPVAIALDAGGRALVADWTEDLLQERRALPAANRALALLHWSLAHLVEGLTEENLARVSRHYAGTAAVLPAIEYIERHLAEPLGNEGLARICHMSADHFIRVFKRFAGQTPAQYVIDARIKRAAQQLYFTRDSIEAVAERTGFRDRYYFTRIFGRRMGQAPAAYRKAQRI